MAENIISKDASELDGSDIFGFTDMSNREIDRSILYVNDLDVDITVDAKVTHAKDTDLSEAYIANTQTVSSGAREADVLNEDAWELIGCTVSFTSAPSNGTLNVYIIA